MFQREGVSDANIDAILADMAEFLDLLYFEFDFQFSEPLPTSVRLGLDEYFRQTKERTKGLLIERLNTVRRHPHLSAPSLPSGKPDNL